MTDPTSPRTAFVTGANRGIGLEIARQLASKGLKVLAGARDAEKAAMAVSALAKHSSKADGVTLDVADTGSILSRLADIERQHGPIDVLVNNAAILIDGPGGFAARLVEMTDATLRATLETNVIGPSLIIRALLPGMKSRGYGRIVNVSSRAGQLDAMGSGFPAYRISKSALNALTCIAAAEAGSADIKVNCCSPGWVRTDMGGREATRSVAQGADTPVWLATLPKDGPTGGFFEDRQPIAW